MAGFATGVTARNAFWRDLNFKAAAVSAASISLLGDAVGHVRQMMTAGNFAPGNAGVPFYTDVIRPLIASGLWLPRNGRIGARRPGEERALGFAYDRAHDGVFWLPKR